VALAYAVNLDSPCQQLRGGREKAKFVLEGWVASPDLARDELDAVRQR
jgi:hypothetical protein